MVVPSTFFHVAHNGPVHHGLVISQTWKPITYQSLWRVCLCLIGYYDFSAWSNDGHREGRITINKYNRVDRGTQRSKLGRIFFFLLEPTVLITMHLWYPALKLTHSRSQDLHFFLFSICISYTNEKSFQCELCLLIWKQLQTILLGPLYYILCVEAVNVYALDWCFTDVCPEKSFQG